jgi:glycosyltransferase involved in cell wall biosynthesis
MRGSPTPRQLGKATTPDRIRVARVITRMNVGGPARHVKLLHEKLDPGRFETRLFFGTTDAREGNLEFGGPSQGVERVRGLKRRLSPVHDVRAYRTLRTRFEQLRPTIVHTHMAKAGTLGRGAARRAGVPILVHTFHGHVLEGYFPRVVNSLFASIERTLARRSDALVAVSEAVRDELLQLGIGRPEQWHVIPVGLELDELLDRTPPADQARGALGLPANGPVVGIVGRLVPIKDHDTFLESARRVVKDRPDVTFVIAGDGELRAELESRARAALGERVRFVGWVEDLPLLYASLDVVVLTSRNEGTPVALVEAGAAARPVVATRVGGVPEVVRDRHTGLLAPAGDAEALAAHVLSLLAAPERARALGTQGRAWVRDRFAATRLAAEVAALYDALLTQRAESPGSPL